MRQQGRGLVVGLLLALAVATAMGQVLFVSRLVLDNACTVRTGSGDPEGVVTGAICDVFLRTDGGAGSTLYVKQSGSGNTGWAAPGGISAGAITSSGLTMATDRLLGRTTASAGAVEEITVGSGLALAAGTLTATGGSGVCQEGEYDTAHTGGSLAVDFDDGAQQIVELDADLVTLTLGNGVDGCTYRILFVQDGTGGHDVTWPGGVEFENGAAPTFDTAANNVTLCSLVKTAVGAGGYLGFCTVDPVDQP